MIKQYTLSDRVVDYLEKIQVDVVFGIPGGHNAPLFAALQKSALSGGTRSIMARHETAAAYMADGYARETGKLGVCCATTGPGASNLLTGVASAYADHIPLLVITAQTPLSHFSWGAFQESSPDTIDTWGMFAHCTRYNTLVSHINQLDRKLYAALNAALHSPRGPAHISIPVDLLRLPLELEKVSPIPDLSVLYQATQSLDQPLLEQVWQSIQACLAQGQEIVLFIGQDCQNATAEIHALAECLNAKLICSQGGKTWVDARHPLACGVFGFAGHVSARQALLNERLGLILAVGSNLGHWATSAWDTVLLNDKLIQIYPSSEYFARAPMARLHVQADSQVALAWLWERAKQKGLTPVVFPVLSEADYLPTSIAVKNPELCQADTKQETVQPPRVLARLYQQLPAETRYFCDVGNWLAWSIHYAFPKQPNRYRLSVGTAAMGWGIGAAIGTAVANPSVPVVCLTGDGCFLMHGNELSVAVEHCLPIVFLIINDRAYGMVKHRYQQVGSAPLDFALPAIDFSLMAQAMGAQGYTIRTAMELETFDFSNLFLQKVPTVIDLHVDVNLIPPLGMF